MTPPISGISFLISLGILGVRKVWRLVEPHNPFELTYPALLTRPPAANLVNAFIVAVVLSISLLVLTTIIERALDNDRSTYSFAYHHLIQCRELPAATPHERLFILRLDDVQAYGWTSISIAMMEAALERNMPIVAGTIAKGSSDDPALNRFMRQHGCNVEVALHGYSHGIGSASAPHELDYGAEFAELGQNAARFRLTAALNELRGLTDQSVVTFIPPENKVSTSTLSVLPEFGITYVSSEGKKPYDYHTATWDFMTDSYVPAERVISDCVSRYLNDEPLCVIMLHPQDYANADASLNTERFRDYIRLLDGLASFDAHAITFRDIATTMATN